MAVTSISRDAVRVMLRWQDVDGYGHLYHATTVTLLDEARGTWLDRFVARSIVEQYVVANLNVSYLQEVLRTDGWIEVNFAVERVGTSSITLNETIRNSRGEIVTTCRTTIVTWNPKKRCSRPLTESEIRAVEAVRDGVTVDTVRPNAL
jgi:YbgC/YbaW family acyl-CoA thioester hydrolase